MYITCMQVVIIMKVSKLLSQVQVMHIHACTYSDAHALLHYMHTYTLDFRRLRVQTRQTLKIAKMSDNIIISNTTAADTDPHVTRGDKCSALVGDNTAVTETHI